MQKKLPNRQKTLYLCVSQSIFASEEGRVTDGTGKRNFYRETNAN